MTEWSSSLWLGSGSHRLATVQVKESFGKVRWIPWFSLHPLNWEFQNYGLPLSFIELSTPKSFNSSATACSVMAVVLNWGQFCPWGDIWQWLEIFLVVTTMGGDTTAFSGQGQECCSTSYSEHTGYPLQQRMIQPIMSIVLKLRNPDWWQKTLSGRFIPDGEIVKWIVSPL